MDFLEEILSGDHVYLVTGPDSNFGPGKIGNHRPVVAEFRASSFQEARAKARPIWEKHYVLKVSNTAHTRSVWIDMY